MNSSDNSRFRYIKTPIFKASQTLIPKFKAWIDKQFRACILQWSPVPGPASIFLEAKSEGRIRPLVDLLFRKDNPVADHRQIPNQQTILQAVAKGKHGRKIDLSHAYFQTRVHSDDVKYNTIITPFGGFKSQVMMQGDMNAPASFVRVRENLFHDELDKLIWIYIDDTSIFSNSLEEHIRHVPHACRKPKEQNF